MVMDALEDFCNVSGQSVSFSESKFFISPNVSQREALSISFKCGMKLSDNLGIYNGVPLVHQRITKHTFDHVIEKI